MKKEKGVVRKEVRDWCCVSHLACFRTRDEVFVDSEYIHQLASLQHLY